ncbi:ZYRO0F04290p [Zygosaccharomyces rouxii]|uniref:ZYRO0F04290p n=1 Tax=Zygosaccharomyces rouxii (strain ATCC 2623 / CBS 732 / NBRC 1130 / NCYC 568 / NRRL Y-229) TaxID=559307 RepID=C5DXE1_ZYGRC|nr:uncharacterized protein ZYRO0F04290g [Zygosaccharomyces rouxii]KAH9199215.1 hypothetical protein LQ764DRAFT_127891 [Zygosaccharomyces rouxii]CAR28452.1 ZYRO0F04290p [Zygosaccharomyces rouxii]
MDRFDRQLRLWGGFGHELLTNGQICFIVERRDDPLLLEVQRHLLLAGISSYLVLHSDKQHTPAKDAFAFIDENQELQALNPEIKPQWNFLPWSRIQTQSFKDISVIVLINCRDAHMLQELSIRREHSINFPPVLVAAVNYPLAYMYLWLKEIHFVVTTNPEYVVPDLRINEPWDEVLQYTESLDFGKLREEELAEIPYPLILSSALRATSQDERPLHQKLDDFYLKYSQQALNDSNYRQAKRYARQVSRSSELGRQRVKQLLNRLQIYQRSNWHDSFNGKFMTLCQALGQFLDQYHQLPLPSEFPDMEAGTQIYNDLKMIYQKKAREDCETMEAIVARLGFPDFPRMLVKKFCDNINYWTLLEPIVNESSVPGIYSSTELTRYLNEQEVTISTHEKKLLENLLSLAEDSYDSHTLVSSFPATAFLGGAVAQEVVKLVTHQYVPIDNTFVYDLISDESSTIKL